MPPPRRVRHFRTLWWWAALLAVVFVAQIERGPAPLISSAGQVPGTEHEAFLTFVFGKVNAGDPAAIQPAALRAQLEQLLQSGAHPVRLEDVQAFLETGKPLPGKPVLLVFDEARRETVEAVDPILAELGIPVATFVNVDSVSRGNVDLVSRRRLRSMAGNGRWEIGVGACHQSNGAEETPAPGFPGTEQLQQAASALRSWTGKPVLAASCLPGWNELADAQERWTHGLDQASIALGFVARSPGANYRGDPASALRLIRITGEERDAETLVRRLAAHTPRHERFVDDFSGAGLASAWVAPRGRAQVQDGKLQLNALPGDAGGLLTLGGTERWRDVRIDVTLAARPSGQFWIYARRNSPTSFLRLGIVEQRVVLQRSDADGQTRQVAATDAPKGPLRLTLRVNGSRAVALLGGELLLDRPVDLPGNVAEGPVSLAVWDEEVKASATVRRVEVEPLPRRVALVPAQPDEDVFSRLRDEADDLWAVSPKLFRWHKGKGVELGTAGLALEIFIRHHHMALLPAVTIDRLPKGKEWERFSERLLKWADQPGYAGLNLVIDRIRPDDLDRIRQLRQAAGQRDKQLTVTVRHGSTDLPMAPDFPWFARAGAGSASFQLASAPLRRDPG